MKGTPFLGSMAVASFVAFVPAALAGCMRTEGGTPEAKTTPARITLATDNGGTPTLELSPSAVERLGLTLAQVERRTVQRTRAFPGELVVPPGARAEFHAPYPALVRSSDRALLATGHAGQGDVLFVLDPLLSAESELATNLQLELARATAEGAIERAHARLDAARTAFERAQALLDAEAGSPRARDEARAEFEVARAELAAGEKQREVLATQSGEGGAGSATLELVAPFAGEVVELATAAGQLVPAGAKLGALERHDPLWIRVPIPVGSAAELPRASAAHLLGPDGRVAPDAPTAQAIEGLPSADAAGWTVDLWFELANPARAFRPGQRVGVELSTTGEESRLIVPWSALVFDVHGGAWVYVQVSATSYRRAAVDLERALGEEALLARGPEPGSEVVATGVAELFGTEFGTGK